MTAQGLTLSPRQDRAALLAATTFSSDSAAFLSEAVPVRQRLTTVVIAALVVSMFAGAFLLPVERVVSARGQVLSQAPRIVVQPLETSIVHSILVREGQVVKKGEILATLDSTFTGADADALAREQSALSAEVARLRHEIEDTAYLPDASDLDGQLQRKIYLSRQTQYRSTLDSLDSRIAAIQSTQKQLSDELAFYRQRLTLTQEIEAMKQSLVASKIASRLEVLGVSDVRLEIQRNIADMDGRLQTSEHELAALTSEREAAIERWKSDTMASLVQQQSKLSSVREELSKAEKRQDLVELRAPNDSIVLKIGDISVGSVAESGRKMFVLTPADSGVEVEAEISTMEQGFLKPGQLVDLKFDAWPSARHGALKGRLRSISADSFTYSASDGGTGRTVYLAKIDPLPEGLAAMPSDFHLSPGMTLTADIVVGEHTVAAYLADRVVPPLTEGMREP